MTLFGRSFAACRFVILLAMAISILAASSSIHPATAQESTPGSSPVSGERTAYPLVVKNCGVDLTLSAAPRRVIVMEPAAISILSTIGALDSVVARVGTFPPEYYSDAVNATIAQIPQLTAETTSTGGAAISLETVLDTHPDLVIGYETESITRDALARFGIGLYVIPPFCKTPPLPSFESISSEVRLYGEMFDRIDAANVAATALEQQVAEVSAHPVAHGEKAAALYVSSDGSAIYGYSKLGMVSVQLTALGFTNIYADLPERVPEVNVESLIDGSPDVLILLYTDTSKTPDEIKNLVTGLPGAEAIPAVKSGRVYPLLFNYSEPPSPLAIEGLVMLQKLLAP